MQRLSRIWALPACPKELEDDKILFLHHLAGLSPLAKLRKDRHGWGSGNYTASEGYHRFASNYNVLGNPKKWNNLWKCSTLPKIELFTWTLLHERILTGENLEKKGFAGPFRCPLCAEDFENISHFFLKCPYAISVWKEVLN